LREKTMKISEKRQTQLCNAISERILDIRLAVAAGLYSKPSELDSGLFYLNQNIWRDIQIIFGDKSMSTFKFGPEYIGKKVQLKDMGSKIQIPVTIVGVWQDTLWLLEPGYSPFVRDADIFELIPEPPKTVQFYPAAYRHSQNNKWIMSDALFSDMDDAKSTIGRVSVIWPYTPGMELPL